MTEQFWQPSGMVPCFFSALSNLHLNSFECRARILLLTRTEVKEVSMGHSWRKKPAVRATDVRLSYT